jgi:hypothetical protein
LPVSFDALRRLVEELARNFWGIRRRLLLVGDRTEEAKEAKQTDKTENESEGDSAETEHGRVLEH